MSAVNKNRILKKPLIEKRKKQQGAEIVEFTMLLLPFFLIIFLSVDMSIMTYNQQMLNHAARYGARQGSLFWIDPAEFDAENPVDNIRINKSTITTGRDYFTNLVISTESINTPKPEIPGADEIKVGGDTVAWKNVSGKSVKILISYDHRYLGFTSLLSKKLKGIGLDSETAAPVEADL